MSLRLLVSFLLIVTRGAASPVPWTPAVTPMQDARWAPAAALLPDGHEALIVGGFSYAAGGCVATADRFDEATKQFLPCRGRLLYPRDFASASPLPDGTLLIAGGYNTVLGTLDTAELYDPSTDAFRLLPSHLSTGRELFTATTLGDGRILFVGGFDTHRHRTQASADLFDPATRTFRPTASLAQDRFGQAAARLADGRVLIVGGKHWQVGHPDVPLASAEIFDPVTGRFHRTVGDMAVPRDRPTATLLSDGRIIIAGGQNGGEGPGLVELFDPKTERFTPSASPLILPRMAHSDVTLLDSRILLAGGWSPPLKTTTATTELFDPQTGVFVSGPPIPGSAHDMALIVFPDGTILSAGGKQVENGKETSLATGSFWLPTAK